MDYFLNEYSLRGQFKDTDEFYDSLREYTLPVLKKIEKEKYCVIWKKDDLWNQNVCENLSMLDVLHMKERGRTEITVLKSKLLKLIQSEPFWSDDKSDLRVREYNFDEEYNEKFNSTNCFIKAFLSEGRVVSFFHKRYLLPKLHMIVIDNVGESECYVDNIYNVEWWDNEPIIKRWKANNRYDIEVRANEYEYHPPHFHARDNEYEAVFKLSDGSLYRDGNKKWNSSMIREIKEWYDGYRFGNADIYCPWDVINYVFDLTGNPKALPKAYWINSSGNDLVKRFIDKADTTTKDEIEQLIAGNAVEKRIRLDLTYDEIDNSIENVWSVLFMTGYLTRTGNDQSDVYQLIIPNKEVREVFVLQIKDWFDRIVADSRASVEKINYGFLEGKTEDIQQELTMFLGETISILDTKARNEEKEIFYHGILIGILKNYSGWAVKSNKESGDGFADILLKPKNPDAGIIIELKYARSMNELDHACERALEQIRERRYDAELREDGRSDILAYGIAFCKKRCKVVVEKL